MRSCRCTRSRRSCSDGCDGRSSSRSPSSPTSPTSRSTPSGCTRVSTVTSRSASCRPRRPRRVAARMRGRTGPSSPSASATSGSTARPCAARSALRPTIARSWSWPAPGAWATCWRRSKRSASRASSTPSPCAGATRSSAPSWKAAASGRSSGGPRRCRPSWPRPTCWSRTPAGSPAWRRSRWGSRSSRTAPSPGTARTTPR